MLVTLLSFLRVPQSNLQFPFVFHQECAYNLCEDPHHASLDALENDVLSLVLLYDAKILLDVRAFLLPF